MDYLVTWSRIYRANRGRIDISDRNGGEGRIDLAAGADVAYLRLQSHSITSSARSRNASGIGRPSTLAVVRLMTRSNLVGCSTGMSAGLVPRNILSMYSAPRRKKSS